MQILSCSDSEKICKKSRPYRIVEVSERLHAQKNNSAILSGADIDQHRHIRQECIALRKELPLAYKVEYRAVSPHIVALNGNTACGHKAQLICDLPRRKDYRAFLILLLQEDGAALASVISEVAVAAI